MATIMRFEELEIWRLARDLARKIYQTYINSQPFNSDYGLKDQINRSSGLLMDNIAEGFERNGRNEFIYFLSIAKGSCGEIKSQLYRALDRNYILQEHFDHLCSKADLLGKKIGAFISYLTKTSYKGTRFKNKLN